MKSFWEERYSLDEYVYGTAPNKFFEAQLQNIRPPGRLLLPAEGEGRNAVFAARLGWQVTAFDQSAAAQAKAQRLAQSHGVNIDYRVLDLAHLDFDEASFDLIALIFVHLSPEVRREYHRALINLVTPGGLFLLEAFSKGHRVHQQRNAYAGGPPDEMRLADQESIREDFIQLECLELSMHEVVLQEGRFHDGPASVIRYVGRKPLDHTG